MVIKKDQRSGIEDDPHLHDIIYVKQKNRVLLAFGTEDLIAIGCVLIAIGRVGRP